MNRLKVWLYVALFVGAGLGNLYFLSRWLTQRGVEQVDRELRAAAAQVELRAQLVAAQAGQLADAAARAPGLAEALASGPAEAAEAVQAAAEGAARAAGVEGAGGLLAAAGRGPGRASARAGGARLTVDATLEELLSAGERGHRAAYLQLDGSIWYVAAAPAGGGTVAVGVPLGAAFVRAVRASAGVDATLLVEGKPPQSTISSPSDLALVGSAARAAKDRAVGVGALPAVRVGSSSAPALPVLFADFPAHRVQAISLRGVASALVAVSLPLGPVLAPVALYQWAVLAALLVLLLIGVVASFLVTEDRAPMVPRELTVAADRIARGDYTARVPPMAGTLGTVASALNRAVEAAANGAARPPEAPFAPEVAALERAPATAALAEPPLAAEPLAEAAAPGDLALAVDASQETDVAAAAEEEHWQVVYEDFVRARESCGDGARSLPYERFRQKLVRNRDQLVEKYACRGVRFQVYVKEGRPALKASPIR